METTQFKPHIIVIALLAATILTILHMGETKVISTMMTNLQLPQELDSYTSSSILYCHNPQCNSSFNNMEIPDTCRECNSSLEAMSLIEKNALPEDTIIQRRIYKDNKNSAFIVSMVLSSKERTSIHRPQMCLPSQGFIIRKQYTEIIPQRGTSKTRVTILNLDTERAVTQKATFAYWFISETRQTPYHIQRMLWTAYDNIFRNTSEQWAYISIMTEVPAGEEDAMPELREFVTELYPTMIRH